MAVGQAGQDRQQVAQAVAPVAVLAERHPGQVEWPAGDRADVVIQHVPLQPEALEALELLREVLGHPAAVDPHKRVESLVDADRIDCQLVRGDRVAEVLGQHLVRQRSAIVERVVVERVVAHAQQVHPVAGLGDLQQAALVHVLVFEPAQRPVDRRPLA
jgi:hypothetical protein